MVNVAKLIHIQTDNVLADSVKACDMINVDGLGMVLGARYCSHKVTEHLAGLDLFYNRLPGSG